MDIDKSKYFEYLDELRKSGEAKMFGAVRYLLEEFPELGSSEKAGEILRDWMDTFDES